MNITIFGYKLRVEIIILCILLMWFIYGNTFFSCAGGVKLGVNVIKEGFEMAAKEGMKAAEKGKKVAVAVAKELEKK